MTTKDLRLQYQRECEESPFDGSLKLRAEKPVADYILYLEGKVIDLENELLETKPDNIVVI